MLRAFSSAVAGMRTQMAYMDVVANNIANVSTTAYKASRARFSDMLYQTLSGGAAASDGMGSVNPTQIGLGVRLSGVDALMNQGALRATGNPLDLAIEGDGFFAVSDGEATYYTRDGAFGLDSEGRLVSPSTGMLVQAVGGGEIEIDTSLYSSVSIGSDGTITGTKADGSGTEEIAQIGVTTFKNPSGMDRAGDNLWKEAAAAGEKAEGAPAEEGRGKVRSGVLEGSNTDLAQEFSNMITAQRGFQANSRVISASDEILQDLVNIKR
jgi:flagellar hook protein FlgE